VPFHVFLGEARLRGLEEAVEGCRNPQPSVDGSVGAWASLWHRYQQAQVQAGRLTPDRCSNNQTCLAHFTGYAAASAPVDSIDASRLQGFYSFCMGKVAARRADPKEGWSVAYARDVSGTTRAFVRWLWEQGAVELPKNIGSKSFKFGSHARVIVTWQAGEFKVAVEKAPGKLRLGLLLMANCGMTQGDVSDLLDTEVDWAEGRVIRRRSKTAGHENVPTVNYKLWPLTWTLLRQYRSGRERVLLTESGQPYVRKEIRNGKLVKADDVPPLDTEKFAELVNRLDRAPGLVAKVVVDMPRLRGVRPAAGEEAKMRERLAALDRYASTPAAAAYLTSASPTRLTGYLRYSDAVLWPLWTHLADAVREETHRWKQAFGLEGMIFEHFFRTEEVKREFLLGMHGLGLLSSPAVASAFDLGRFRRLADLGGATGHLAVAACRRWPQLHAVVFDLPAVLRLARTRIAQTEVADRVECVAGDFFADALPEADLYALGRVVHDWSEEKARTLLRRVYERLPSGGALLVAEAVLDDDRSGPPWAALQSWNMLVCTEGKERTAAEYDTLLRGVGFARVEARRTGTPLDAVLATKE